MVIPTESQEGDTLVAYLRIRGIKFTHIPNETGHSDEMKRRAIRMKRQGTSRGFPDYVIALPKVGVLYVELKRIKRSVTSPEQVEWIDVLNECPGTEAMIARGAEQAITYIEKLYPLSNNVHTEF